MTFILKTIGCNLKINLKCTYLDRLVTIIKETDDFIVKDASLDELKLNEEDFIRYIQEAEQEINTFSTLIIGIIFGIMSGLVASIIDNAIRGQINYPVGYLLLILLMFTIVLFMIYRTYQKLRKKIRSNKFRLEEVRRAIKGESTILNFATVHEKNNKFRLKQFQDFIKNERIYFVSKSAVQNKVKL